MSQNLFFAGQAPVPPAEVRIESVGVNPLDQRRVDVAVDLTPCLEPLTVELVVVGPDDTELCSALLVGARQWELDKVLHLRHDAQPGEHVLHVGVFFEQELLTRAAWSFRFPQATDAA